MTNIGQNLAPICQRLSQNEFAAAAAIDTAKELAKISFPSSIDKSRKSKKGSLMTLYNVLKCKYYISTIEDHWQHLYGFNKHFESYSILVYAVLSYDIKSLSRNVRVLFITKTVITLYCESVRKVNSKDMGDSGSATVNMCRAVNIEGVAVKATYCSRVSIGGKKVLDLSLYSSVLLISRVS